MTAVPHDFQTTQNEPGKIPVRQEICKLFTPSSSKTDPRTKQDLVRTAKELGRILKGCRFAKHIDQDESTAYEPSYNSHTTNSVRGVDCDCEGECFCGNFVLGIGEDLSENNQVSQGNM